MTPNRATEKISKLALDEFAKKNGFSQKDMAEASGYSYGGYLRAVRNGYMNQEAVFDLCRFFDLPRNYFEGAHGDEVILRGKKTEEAPAAQPQEPEETDRFDDEIRRKIDTLIKAYGFVSEQALMESLINGKYDEYERTIANRYKDLSKDELIARLVERDLDDVAMAFDGRKKA